jgi:flavin-dependent dehydrogenase
MLDRLGVLDRVREIGVHKPGAEFISEDGSIEQVFEFRRALTPGPSHAYQVLRSEFDALLFARAREAGATALEETTASVISCDAERAVVELRGADGAARLFETGLLVDASGRSTVMARMRGEKKPDPNNTSAAIFGHFHGIPRHEGARGGNIRIHLTDPGWMWQIPLRDGVTSIGLVAPGHYLAGRTGSIDAFFRAHVARHPHIGRMIEAAEPAGPLRSTGNFSYRADAASGPGHLKVGDAYGFIDPVFSTGVQLALSSAEEAARAILEARRRPAARDRIFAAYDRHIRWRIGHVSWFIYRIHDPAFREMMLNPRNILGIEQAVISLLAGDFRQDPRLAPRIWLFKLLRDVVAWRRSAAERRTAGDVQDA